jgi:hypothetical protein
VKLGTALDLYAAYSPAANRFIFNNKWCNNGEERLSEIDQCNQEREGAWRERYIDRYRDM